jgi:hypothetical protein
MFDSALGIIKVIGPFILVAALIYAVLHIRNRSRRLNRERDRATRQLYTDERAQRDNLKFDAHVGERGARPASPSPNDIT